MHQRKGEGLPDILESRFMWQAPPDNSIDSEFNEMNPVKDSDFGTQ